MAVVGEYAGRPLYSLPPHHRRPNAGPATQSLKRERNPKGSRRRLCATAVRGPPTVLQGKCRRCRAKERDLRRFCKEKCRRCRAKERDLRRECGKSVGDAGRKKGTSDGNAGKVSEVSGKREGPPTDSQGLCRRSFGC